MMIIWTTIKTIPAALTKVAPGRVGHEVLSISWGVSFLSSVINKQIALSFVIIQAQMMTRCFTGVSPSVPVVNTAEISICNKLVVKCHQSNRSSATCSLYSKHCPYYKLWSSHIKYLYCSTDCTKVTEEGTTEHMMAQEEITALISQFESILKLSLVLAT